MTKSLKFAIILGAHGVPLHSSSPLAHRIAVANIAVFCTSVDDHTPFTLAIMNDSARKKGRIEFGAIGGGALITTAGMTMLQSVAPIDFELHDDGISHDARMTLRSEGIAARREQAIHMLIGWAKTGKSSLIELDITRELIEELVDDEPGIISRHDVMSIQSRCVGWKIGAERQSSRGESGVTTTPLYFCHALHFEDSRVLDSFQQDRHGRIRWIGKRELATTNGGMNEGSTRSGHRLFSNVFPKTLINAF